MGAREMLRLYRPNFSLPVEDLNPKEIFEQFLYLDAGLADKRDTRTEVSLGLSEKLIVRRNALSKMIVIALEEKYVVKKNIPEEMTA